MTRVLGLLIAVVVCVAGWSDGCFMGPRSPDSVDRIAGRTGVSSTAQKGIIVELPDSREALLLQTTYNGPAAKFAWVIPVPGRPGRDDVFLANPSFIDEVFSHTEPRVSTEIEVRRPHREFTLHRALGPVPEPGAPSPAGPATVTVHERMEVGDFDAVVLSATGDEVLVDWLREHGFHVPEDAVDVFGHYVEKSWYFVALRLLPRKAQEQPILEDVAPVGIRFPTDKLVYPLYISRASSREKTALLLGLISRVPAVCDELPEVAVPTEEPFPKGSSYARIRRETLERAGRGLICEYRGSRGLNYWDLGYEKDKWQLDPKSGADPWNPANMVATRLWTVLALQDMEDLHFSLVRGTPFSSLLVERKGAVYYPLVDRWDWFRQGVAGSPLGALLCMLVAVVLYRVGGHRPARRVRKRVIIPTGVLAVVLLLLNGPLGGILILIALLYMVVSGRSAEELPAGGEEPPPAGCLGAMVAGGLGFLGYGLFRVISQGLADAASGNTSGASLLEYVTGGDPGVYLLLAAVQLAWLVALIVWITRFRAKVGPQRVPLDIGALVLLAVLLTCVGLLWLVVRSGSGDALSDIWRRGGWGHAYMVERMRDLLLMLCTLWGMCWCASVAIIGPSISAQARRWARPIGLALVGVAVVCALLSGPRPAPLAAGLWGVSTSEFEGLDSALKQMDHRLTRFREQYGCYPAKLEDLVGDEVPTNGVDSSANTVAISGTGGSQKGLDGLALPIDPLTGKRDTWVYEPTGSPMVDSGGYTLLIKSEPVPAGPLGIAASYYGVPRELTGESLLGYPREGTSGLQYGPPGGDGWIGFPATGESPGYCDYVLVNDREAQFWYCESAGSEPYGFAVSPDGRDAVFALCAYSRLERTGYPGTTLVRASALGTDRAPVLERPWPIVAAGPDWHPTKDAWLVLGRDERGEGASTDEDDFAGAGMVQLYVIEPGQEPRAVGPRDYFVKAVFAADGQSALAAVHEDTGARKYLDRNAAKYGVMPASGVGYDQRCGLYRVDLSDGTMTRLTANVFHKHFGRFFAAERGAGSPMRIHWFREEASEVVTVPEPEYLELIVDVWADEEDLLTVSATEAKTALWRYSLGSTAWECVGSWPKPPPETEEKRSLRVDVLGRDPSSGGWLVLDRSGGRPELTVVGKDGSLRTMTRIEGEGPS